MKVYIDNSLIAYNQLAMPVMNYGQGKNAHKYFKYRIEIQIDDLMALIEPIYKQLINDEINDNFNKKGDWPDLDTLKELNYPSIEKLINSNSDLLEKLILEWMEMELLATITKKTQKPCYWIDSLNKVEINKDSNIIILEGNAYSLV